MSLRHAFSMSAPQMPETGGRRCVWELRLIQFFSGGLDCATRSATRLRRAPGTAALLTLFKLSGGMVRTRNRPMFALSVTYCAVPSCIKSIVITSIVVLIALTHPGWAADENASAANAVAGEVANKQQMHRLFPDPTANT